MNCIGQTYKVSKINLSTSIFLSQNILPANPYQQEAYITQSSNLRLNQTYKKCFFKLQEKKKSHAIADKDQCSFDNQQQLHVKKKQSLSTNLQIIKRRSLQMNPGFFMVKQKNKTKVQNIKIDSVSQKSLIDQTEPTSNNHLTKSLSQRSQKNQKISIDLTVLSHHKMRTNNTTKNISPSKQRQQTQNTLSKSVQNNLPNSGINPYTNKLYLHSRNLKIDEMRKIKNKRKIHHQNSIVQSYKVKTIQLNNPLERYRKITRNPFIQQHDTHNNQISYLQDHCDQDRSYISIYEPNKRRNNNIAKHNSLIKKDRPMTSKIYQQHKDVWTEDEPAPWPSQLNVTESLQILNESA